MSDSKYSATIGAPSSPGALPAGTVVLDSVRVAWQKSFSGLWRSSLGSSEDDEFLWQYCQPLTVLYNPHLDGAQ